MAKERLSIQTPRHPYLPYSQPLAIGLATLSSIYFCVLVMRPFFSALAWSLAFAITMYPLFNWLAARIKSRSLATFMTLFFAVLLLGAPTWWIVRLLIETTLLNLQALTQRSAVERWLDPSTAPPKLAAILNWLEYSLRARDVIYDFLQTLTQRFPRMVTMSLVGIIEFLIVLFTTFFFIRDAKLFLDSMKWALPFPPDETERVVIRVIDTVHAALFGVVLVAILQGFLGGFIFWWLSLPQPIVWGVVMGLLALVPYLGTFIVWIPTAVVLASRGEWQNAIILVTWGSIVVGLSDNLLYPFMVGRRLHYHTLIIFFFLLGGVLAFGSAGIVIGPTILSVTHGLIEMWQVEGADNERESHQQVSNIS